MLTYKVWVLKKLKYKKKIFSNNINLANKSVSKTVRLIKMNLRLIKIRLKII